MWSSSTSVKTDAVRGRHVVCTRPVAKGAVIISEKPFAYTLNVRNADRLCHTCLKESPNLSTCSRCKEVSYCSSECQKADRVDHTKECQSICKVKPHVPTQTMRLMLRVIRRLDRESQKGDGSVCAAFRKLVSHQDSIKAETKVKYAQMAGLVRDCRVTGEELPIFEDLKAIVELFCTFENNNFSILNDDLQTVGAGLFVESTALNHSCAPNAVATFEGPVLSVRATKDIGRGEEVTISYIELAASTDARRAELQPRYFFDCQCKLCTDGLERDLELGRLADSVNPMLKEQQQQLTQLRKCILLGHENKKKCNYSEAQRKYLEALRLQKGKLGPHHLFAFETLDGLVQCCIELQDFDGALKYTGLSLPFYEYIYSVAGAHPSCGLQYYTHAKLAWLLGETDPAYASVCRALQILTVTHGESHSLLHPLRELAYQVQRARA